MASYRVEVDSPVRKEMRRLPGHVRQSAVRCLRSLATEPRPPNSRTLDLAKAGIPLGEGDELRRIRIES